MDQKQTNKQERTQNLWPSIEDYKFGSWDTLFILFHLIRGDLSKGILSAWNDILYASVLLCETFFKQAKADALYLFMHSPHSNLEYFVHALVCRGKMHLLIFLRIQQLCLWDTKNKIKC